MKEDASTTHGQKHGDAVFALAMAFAIPKSDYPRNFIPAGARVFISVDPGSPDGDCAVKGFVKDGIIHVQEVEWHGVD